MYARYVRLLTMNHQHTHTMIRSPSTKQPLWWVRIPPFQIFCLMFFFDLWCVWEFPAAKTLRWQNWCQQSKNKRGFLSSHSNTTTPPSPSSHHRIAKKFFLFHPHKSSHHHCYSFLLFQPIILDKEITHGMNRNNMGGACSMQRHTSSNGRQRSVQNTAKDGNVSSCCIVLPLFFPFFFVTMELSFPHRFAVLTCVFTFYCLFVSLCD